MPALRELVEQVASVPPSSLQPARRTQTTTPATVESTFAPPDMPGRKLPLWRRALSTRPSSWRLGKSGATSSTSSSLSSITIDVTAPRATAGETLESQPAMSSSSAESGAAATERAADDKGPPSNHVFATQSDWLAHQLGPLTSSTSDSCNPSVDATSEGLEPAPDENRQEALARSRNMRV